MPFPQDLQSHPRTTRRAHPQSSSPPHGPSVDVLRARYLAARGAPRPRWRLAAGRAAMRAAPAQVREPTESQGEQKRTAEKQQQPPLLKSAPRKPSSRQTASFEGGLGRLKLTTPELEQQQEPWQQQGRHGSSRRPTSPSRGPLVRDEGGGCVMPGPGTEEMLAINRAKFAATT